MVMLKYFCVWDIVFVAIYFTCGRVVEAGVVKIAVNNTVDSIFFVP